MYDFIDTNEVSEGTHLPSEALSINGEYIEHQLAGYRTLYVSGREALSPELTSHETGVRDGSVLRHKRFPARKITVGYHLVAEDAKAFREAYNKLASILNTTEARLIFHDETDKFFVGTPSLVREVEAGRNSVVGEFEIFCADPFKYSLKEYEATEGLLENSLKVEYNGTYKSYPKIVAEFYKENEADGSTTNKLTGYGDCGYVAFYNDKDKIIQLGSAEETDGAEVPRTQTLVNQAFYEATGWGTAAKNQWPLNNGVTFEPNITEQVGTVDYYAEHKYLGATNYGSSSKLWHGPTITRTIPADAAGVAGAKDWWFEFGAYISIGEGSGCTNQKGGMRAIISDADGNVIAGVYVYKSAVGKNGIVRTVLNNELVEKWDADMSYENGAFGVNGLHGIRIVKSGNRVQFVIGAYRQSYFCEDIADSVATKITFLFFKRLDNPEMEKNGISWVKFEKNTAEGWQDVPNKFTSNDVVEVDCRTGGITLNGIPAPELGALGNDWEDFYLTSGLNQIGYSYSDWVEDAHAPTIKLKYREVFL